MEHRPILLNARAALRPTLTGVERWAREILPRLVAVAPERYKTVRPHPPLQSRAGGQAWEQVVLPLLAARARAPAVFSPANLAPWAWPRNVVVVHDAAVLRYPGAYSRTYRAWHARFGIACVRRALAIITVSEFSRGELVELMRIEPERITVIPGGVDRRFSADADRERTARRYALERPYVLTVATDDVRKNLPALARASKRLATLGIELVWAGDARPYFAAGGTGDGLRYLGYVPDHELPGLYAGALAFVLPSRYEGFGLPCLEAMASGVPVVASDRGAIPEVCGGAGLLVDPDDTDQLADAVVRAATDAGLRRTLRDAGTQRAHRYSWDRAAAAVDRLLTSVALSPESGPRR